MSAFIGFCFIVSARVVCHMLMSGCACTFGHARAVAFRLQIQILPMSSPPVVLANPQLHGHPSPLLRLIPLLLLRPPLPPPAPIPEPER
eukprot:9482144-Pyramimonas_sp.AAC.1